MIDCTDEQLIEEVRRRGFVIRDAQIRATLTAPFTEEQKMFAYKKEKKEWVGLTEAELDEAMEYWSDDSRSTYGGARIADGEYVNMRDTWRYIEAKLKEKNT